MTDKHVIVWDGMQLIGLIIAGIIIGGFFLYIVIYLLWGMLADWYKDTKAKFRSGEYTIFHSYRKKPDHHEK